LFFRRQAIRLQASQLTASRPHIEPLPSRMPSKFRCSLAGPRWAKLLRGSHGAGPGQRHGRAAPHSLPLVLTCKVEFGTNVSLVRFHLLSSYSAAAWSLSGCWPKCQGTLSLASATVRLPAARRLPDGCRGVGGRPTGMHPPSSRLESAVATAGMEATAADSEVVASGK
jgi:hypothetical protein